MKKYLVCGLLIGSLFYSCKDDRGIVVENSPSQDTEQRNTLSSEQLRGSYVQGRIYIYTTESAFERLSINNLGDVVMSSLPSQMTQTLTAIKATGVERLFPDAGKYEQRSRRMGMHRWFKVTFDENVPSSDACAMLSDLPEVEYAEQIPTIQMPAGKIVPVSNQEVQALRSQSTTPFNDPLLPSQWHYFNTGKAPGAKVGADINLFPAWEVQSGKRNVIVAIVDGGIDTQHEDLVENLCINEAEQKGTKGVDDDNNGYIDDIYGYNFVTGSPLIEPDYASHGTHVAGTVSARNNNAVGVCGVAGGDGSAGSGARLLSCQIFRKEREGSDTPAALKYGADNGAVISQNSWGYNYPGPGSLSRALQVAIDYFIKFAGCDADGNQLPDSPMKGGVVIFAAGNDGMDYKAYPAAYEKVISVSSMSTNFTKAGYSNMGDWVTIMAPGGDQFRYGNAAGVLSTLAPSVPETGGQRYGYYQGTSMACPHVSGVAALVVSQKGGPGFTAKMLEDILKSSILDVDIDKENPGLEGRLGKGYIDTKSAVVSVNQQKAPATPKVDMAKVSKETKITDISLYWNIPADEDDGKPIRFYIYMADKEFSASDYQLRGTLVSSGSAQYISAVGRKVGEEMSFKIESLEENTTYYFALVAQDRWGLTSAPAIFTVKTKPNSLPVVTGVPTQVVRFSNISDKETFVLTVSDPDGHRWTMDKLKLPKGVSVKQVGDKINVSLRPVLDPGKYEFTLAFTDQLRGKTVVKIPFEIYEIVSPKIALPISNQLMGLDQPTMGQDLTKVFSYTDDVPVKFSASSSDGTIASVTIEDNKLVVNAHKYGRASIRVVADNGVTAPTSLSFEVRIIKDKSVPVYSIYPIPTKDKLNVWLNTELKSATLVITTMSGEELLNKSVTPDDRNVGTINISDFVPGTYKLTVNTAKGSVTKTIVKK